MHGVYIRICNTFTRIYIHLYIYTCKYITHNMYIYINKRTNFRPVKCFVITIAVRFVPTQNPKHIWWDFNVTLNLSCPYLSILQLVFTSRASRVFTPHELLISQYMRLFAADKPRLTSPTHVVAWILLPYFLITYSLTSCHIPFSRCLPNFLCSGRKIFSTNVNWSFIALTLLFCKMIFFRYSSHHIFINFYMKLTLTLALYAAFTTEIIIIIIIISTIYNLYLYFKSTLLQKCWLRLSNQLKIW